MVSLRRVIAVGWALTLAFPAPALAQQSSTRASSPKRPSKPAAKPKSKPKALKKPPSKPKAKATKPPPPPLKPEPEPEPVSPLTPPPAPTPDDVPDAPVSLRPRRHGFTLELGLGGALTHISPRAGAASTSFGLAPLSLGFGAFATRDLAFLARLAGTSYFDRGANGDTTQFVHGFYGIHVQYWVKDNFMVSGGPGLALLGENAFLAPTRKPKVGFGGSVRMAYAFLAARHHALRLALELFPAKYPGAVVFGSALNLEWQYY